MSRQRFAIITFRDTGPLKSWQAVRGAQIHNARTKPIEHGVPGAPSPVHLIGTGDLEADVRARLVGAKLDPDRLRKNGVLVYEAVMTASPEFFDEGDAAAQKLRLDAWVKAQFDFAVSRYGRHRIASMVLHLDEKTPHIHLVVLPLDVKSDRRRRVREVRWGLNGRTISGPGQFDRLQDDYAAAMAPFGLVRGLRHSGAKHEPPAIFMRRMAEQQLVLDEREAAIAKAIADLGRQHGEDMTALLQRQRLVAEREQAADRRQAALDIAEADGVALIERRRREAEDAIAKREAEAARAIEEARLITRQAHEIRTVALRAQMAAKADQEAARKAKAAAEADRAAAMVKKADAERIADYMAEARAEVDERLSAASRSIAAAEADRVETARCLTALRGLGEHVRQVRAELKALPAAQRPPEKMAVHRSAVRLERAAAHTHVPGAGIDPVLLASFQAMQQRGASMGG